MTKHPTLLCATGNPEKFALGQRAFLQHGIMLEQIVLEIDEIQGEDADVILRDKAKRAFEAIGKPVLVSDDSWNVPALNGFPGAYMKSMNHWFAPDDFLRLMAGKDDRTIYLEQRLAYIDETEVVTFSKQLKGVFVEAPRGNSGPPIMRVVELDGDEMTISELFDKGIAEQKGMERDAWTEAAQWYAAKIGVTA